MSASPQAVADRIDLLHSHGHTWMPPEATSALASSDHSDNDLLAIADGMKNTLAQSWSGFTEAFDDSVLHKQPSHALALARYLHASLGPLPVRQDDLHVIQTNLQKAGFGAGLDINGVWGADWNSAYNEWADNYRTRQLAGDRPGSVSTAHAGHSIFSSLLPSHVVNAVVGFAKSLPGDVRDLASDITGYGADVAGGIAQAGEALLHGDVAGAATEVGKTGVRFAEGPIGTALHGERTGLGRQVGRTVGNLADQTPESQRQFQDQHGFGRLLEDVGTVLALVPIAGEGSAAARVARGAWEGGVDRALAERTTGSIAKSFFGGLKKEDLAKVGGDVTRTSLRRGPVGAGSRLFQNVPLLRQVGPAVGRLADADGLYYKSRTLLAAPYALPGVRVAGALGQRYMIGGAALNLAAGGEQAIGADNPMASSILNDRTADTIDLNLGRIIGAPNAHVFTHAVDSLGFVLHGPLGSAAASTKVGDVVQSMTDGMSSVLGHYNAEGAWERAVAKATGEKTRITDLRSAFGSDELFDRFMANKVADLAASHHAQAGAQREGLAFGSEEYRTRVGQLADEVWNNPDLHETAVKELLADPIELENRIAVDMVHNRLHPSAYHPDMVDEVGGAGHVDNYAANGIAWMTAGSHLQDIITSGLAGHMFGSDGKTIIANAQDMLDHGGDVATATRLSGTTRRDYVTQVSTLLGQVRRQVDKARTQLGQSVARYEQQLEGDTIGTDVRSLRGKLQSAKQMQVELERALDDGNLARVAEMMNRTTSVRKTRREWDRLVHDASRLRTLVDQGTPERLTLTHILENGVNPDELYTNINGPARHDPRVGSGDWLREQLQHKNGVLGLARLDTKTAQEATADVGRFRARLEAAGRDQDKVDALVEEAKNYGFREFGMTEHTLGVFGPQDLLDRLDQQAHSLASGVFLTWDAPPELKAKLAQIEAAGYKPVLGSHIGHLWDHSLPSMPELRGAVSRRRRAAGVFGLSPEQVSSRAAGQDASIRVLREINQATQDPRFRLPPRTTAETILQVLRDDGLVDPELKLPEQVATTITRKFHKPGIKQLAEDRKVDYDTASKIYHAEMARALQLRDLSRAKFIKALTTPADFSNGARWEGMDKTSANLVRRAVLRGYSDRPGYIQGLSTLEDWARGGFSLGGKISPAVRFAGDNPLAELMQRAAELPNSLVNLRNRLRFTLSPFFDFRRVAKQNVKMNIDGVTPVLNPLKHMVDQDTFTKAHKFLSKLIGDPQYMGFDDADRYLHQQSVWGLYNSRHFEAYYAWEKKAAGATDDEIRQGIRRVFEYGSTRKEGRSALERTVNTIFFPFSFEKTLLRNVGAYMIDHPQQALLLTGAITAYDEANQHSAVHQWVQDHLPILRDLEKLNAFAHGISPGEMGGINAPLLNLFLPQKWDGGFTKDNLKRFLPIWNDFGQLLHDSREQAVISKNAVLNAGDYAIALGHPRDPLDPYRPTVTPEAQQRKAYQMRNQAILAWTPVLDYNLHHSLEAEKYTFPDDPRLPTSVRGKAVNRTTIGELVKVWYPAYNPAAARTYAEKQADAATQYVDNLTDPVKRQQYGVFVKLADVVQGHLQRGDYDTPTSVQVMMQFRTVAANAAETDPTFYAFYNSHYRYLFGPLEEVSA